MFDLICYTTLATEPRFNWNFEYEIYQGFKNKDYLDLLNTLMNKLTV